MLTIGFDVHAEVLIVLLVGNAVVLFQAVALGF